VAESHRGFVLFVDDDFDTREIAEMTLLNAGPAPFHLHVFPGFIISGRAGRCAC